MSPPWHLGLGALIGKPIPQTLYRKRLSQFCFEKRALPQTDASKTLSSSGSIGITRYTGFKLQFLCCRKANQRPGCIRRSPLQFLSLFTQDEQFAMTTAAQTNAQLSLFIVMLSASDAINMPHQSVRDGMQYLLSINVLTQRSIDQITQGLPESQT
jgi:hypothetical protein